MWWQRTLNQFQVKDRETAGLGSETFSFPFLYLCTDKHKEKRVSVSKPEVAEKKNQACLATLGAAVWLQEGEMRVERSLLEIDSTEFVEISSSIALLEDV